MSSKLSVTSGELWLKPGPDKSTQGCMQHRLANVESVPISVTHGILLRHRRSLLCLSSLSKWQKPRTHLLCYGKVPESLGIKPGPAKLFYTCPYCIVPWWSCTPDNNLIDPRCILSSPHTSNQHMSSLIWCKMCAHAPGTMATCCTLIARAYLPKCTPAACHKPVSSSSWSCGCNTTSPILPSTRFLLRFTATTAAPKRPRKPVARMERSLMLAPCFKVHCCAVRQKRW